MNSTITWHSSKLESTASWAATLANRGDKKIQVFETISKRIYYRMPQVKERKYEEPSGESITSQVRIPYEYKVLMIN